MIIPKGIINGVQTVDIAIVADAAWNDSFFYVNGTRPLAADWVSVELIIRPAFDHATLIRKLSSADGSPEILVDNADEAAFSIRVAQSVVTTFARLPGGLPATYAQMLRFRYAADDADVLEGWRGALIVNPGLTG